MRKPVWLVLLLLLSGSPRMADAQTVRYQGSLQYITGTYVFDARSHALVLGTGLTASRGPWDGSISWPVLLQNGGVTSTLGERWIPTGGAGHRYVSDRAPGQRIQTRRSSPGSSGHTLPQTSDSLLVFDSAYRLGLGDPVIRMSIDLLGGVDRGRLMDEGLSPPRLGSLRVEAGTKVPVRGVEGGAGTGQWDFLLGVSGLAVMDRVLVMADAGYWWYGDLPDLELRDGAVWGVSVGSLIPSSRWSFLATLQGSQRPVATMAAPLSLGVTAGYRTDRGWILSGGLHVGLTESTSDVAVSVGWSRRVWAP